MGKTIALFLLTSLCFSQNSKPLELTIAKIDSLATIESKFIHDLGGKIEETITSNDPNSTVITGEGWLSLSPYGFNFDQAYYNQLTNVQKRKYNSKHCFKLIKTVCTRNMNYNNGDFTNVTADFYYNDEQLFFVKIKEIAKVNQPKESINQACVFVNEIDSLENRFTFNNDIKKWIIETNNQMLEKIRE